MLCVAYGFGIKASVSPAMTADSQHGVRVTAATRASHGARARIDSAQLNMT